MQNEQNEADKKRAYAEAFGKRVAAKQFGNRPSGHVSELGIVHAVERQQKYEAREAHERAVAQQHGKAQRAQRMRGEYKKK